MNLRERLLNCAKAKVGYEIHNEPKKDRITVLAFRDKPPKRKWVFRWDGEPLDKPTHPLTKEESSLL
jgi:hypothetical protein